MAQEKEQATTAGATHATTAKKTRTSKKKKAAAEESPSPTESPANKGAKKKGEVSGMAEEHGPARGDRRPRLNP